MSIKYFLNLEPIVPIYTHDYQPRDIDYITDNFKNIDYKHIKKKCVSNYCKNIIDIMFSQIKDHKKYQYVFVKVQFLKAGQNTSGTSHWHLDSSMNPEDFYENFIFTTGLHNNTEFFQTPIQIQRVETSLQFHRQIEKAYREEDSYYTKPLTIYKYNGNNVHRGRLVITEEPRILIRLQNTDRKLTVYN